MLGGLKQNPYQTVNHWRTQKSTRPYSKSKQNPKPITPPKKDPEPTLDNNSYSDLKEV